LVLLIAFLVAGPLWTPNSPRFDLGRRLGENVRTSSRKVLSMTDYQPTWRRPIAHIFRRTAGTPVQWCVRLGIHPNLVSCSSIGAAAGAGVCFWQAGAAPGLLIAAVGFCYLRLWLNMLDGMVALASNTASRSGEIANELPDRISDVIIFVGVAHSDLCHPLGGYWAAIFALLVAYVGTLGQAVGVQREFSGMMAKPWRMVALHAGAWITLGLLWWGDGTIHYGDWTVLDWTLLAILLGCVQTIWIRLTRILRGLHEQAAKPASAQLPPKD
jgi:phosphatidylglycerophosphate synthase